MPLPFGPTMPMRSPRSTRSEKSATTGRSKLFEMPFASITSAPDRSASAAAMATVPVARRASRRCRRSACEAGHAAHVALAPRGDAVAHPVLLRHDLAVELVEVALLLRQHLVAPRLEIGEAALDAPRLAAVEPHGDARQVGEEAPVVADDDDRRAAAGEIALEPFDGGKIEMVGRLVEQQDVGIGREHARERGAPRLAAGELSLGSRRR